MDNRTVKGIVEDVNNNWKSVKINGENFSGKFTYKGEMPRKGDSIEMEVVSSVSKKDNKTYWNILNIKTIKANTTPNDTKVEFRLNVDAGNCLQRAVELIVSGKTETTDLKAETLKCVVAFKEAIRELTTTPEPIKQIKEETFEDY